MAEVVLKLVINPETGAREVVVDYRSDEDALPVEHEEEHRDLVRRVLEGTLSPEGVIVEREHPAAADVEPERSAVAEEGRRKEKA